jgi:hypothetical protein
MTNEARISSNGSGRRTGLSGDLPSDESQFRDVREFGHRKADFWAGAICTSGFIVLGVGSFLAAWWNIDGSYRHPRPTAIGFGMFWSCWVALGGWILLAYSRERLVISTDQIRQSGCFRTRSMLHDEVKSARWRRFFGRGGSLVLRSATTKIVVHFDIFTDVEQADLRIIFRSILDDRVQENWESYEASIVFRLPRALR